jgi:hypothetical protein
MSKYQYSLIPLLVAFLWVFIYIPFLAVIPCAYIYLSIDKEEYVDFERITYNSTAFLIVLAILLIMFITYLFFKRQDAERKQKFVANKVTLINTYNS